MWATSRAGVCSCNHPACFTEVCTYFVIWWALPTSAEYFRGVWPAPDQTHHTPDTGHVFVWLRRVTLTCGRKLLTVQWEFAGEKNWCWNDGHASHFTVQTVPPIKYLFLFMTFIPSNNKYQPRFKKSSIIKISFSITRQNKKQLKTMLVGGN